ncbi:hypothetical protein QVD17_40087 [Tagetes erecta]|uniref:Transcription factor GRAS n=1 Tax=Tagetes erecta TaxID=13708 RepID=A0AAD8JPK7_TARER|nr:hypothetical protein QVD17_40087 [Tagetes erecta]
MFFLLGFVKLQSVYIFVSSARLRFSETMKKPNGICNHSNEDVIQESEILGKLPLLYDDDSGYKSRRFLSSTENDYKEHEPQTSFHELDALFQDTTPPICLQELADIESQYSELIKPCAEGQDVVGSEASERKLSTDEVIRLGGERFIQSRSSTSINNISISSHPYVSLFSGLSDQELKEIQLVEYLLLCSEKVSQQHFERSSMLLDWCDELSSSSGNPIQRIVYYFSKALREKIDKETKGITLSGLGKKHVYDIESRMMNPNMTTISIYQKLPFYQAGHFSGTQVMVDRLSRSKRVHVIDLSIRQGVHSTILMQALSSQPDSRTKHLKITAVGTGFETQIKQTGDRLKSFAASLNLSFSFNMVIVEDMRDFNKDLLELDSKEALGVYSSYGLWSLIPQQDRLEHLMKVIKSTKPRVMLVCETATNLNSSSFVNRFIEALFHYGAVFDSLEDCMDREDENRLITESMYLGKGIRSIVTDEGSERVIRHVNIDVWRKFFSRFGMKEIGFSISSLYQAMLVAEKISGGSSCTFDMEGNSLVIGWKGTPIQCLSAWKFS